MTDPLFGDPFVDVDEYRDAPRPHRYIHGGFAGTETRFSCYFPPPDQYEGRFFQPIEGGTGGSEHTATTTGPLRGVASLGHAFARGAYVVESNQGHAGTDLTHLTDLSLLQWRASAQAARFSRELARDVYGQAPNHGYCYGSGGGALRSVFCLENAPDVWNGAAANGVGHPSQATLFSLLANATRILAGKLTAISDAVEVGGTGDPFESLTTRERQVLAALYRTGFPRHVSLEPPLESQFVGGAMLAHLLASDPDYFEDFWSVPGYAGASSSRRPSERCSRLRNSPGTTNQAGTATTSRSAWPPTSR